ncbi:hypothetical protein ONZ45_g11233 [Pleurotus djamor]|nr:hypothetical protein ONZ45_g11233 [Pleurotus djamor]
MASARPVPPFDLGQCKAQARSRSYGAVKNLVAYIEHLDIKEQLDIWDIFAEILAESPPSIEVLKKCFLPTEAPVVRCRIVLKLLQGISLTLIRYESNMLQEMPLIEKLKAIWTDIWKWVHSTFLYHRHSPLPRSTKTLINDSDSMSDSTFQVVAMCQLCALYLSCTGKDYVSVMFTPSFIHLFSSWWLESAGNRSVSLQVCQMICLLVKLFVQFEDVPTTMVMVEALGSSASFATCLLTYLRVDARETSPASLISVYSGVMLGCSLTEDIHRELHAQNAVQIVVSVLGGIATSGTSQTIAELIEYLTYSMRTAGQSQARIIFKSHILLVLVAVASRQFNEPHKSLFPAIAKFFNIFGQFCLYRSNIKALMQPMDELQEENWQGHFETPELEGAWSLFKECFAEGKSAKERRDSPLKMCTSMITLHPDMSDAAYAQIGDVTPTRLAQFHPCLLVFAALPPVDRSKLLFIHGTLQPSPSYTSYQEFLDSSPDPDASQAQLQLEIASESLFPDVSFRWVTGGDWDSDSVTI